MPTITTVDVAWQPGPVEFTDAEARRFDTAMFLGDGSNNGVRGGVVRHGDNSLAVSINGSDQVTVQAGAAVIPAATGLGVYRAALSAATAATAIDSRNATNPRIDLVVFRATGAVDIITGTPGASPSAPALPASTVELGRINVPALGAGAVTVDSTWRAYASAIGGTLYVETVNRLPGSGNIKGQPAVALDTGIEYRWTGTAWLPSRESGTATLGGTGGANIVSGSSSRTLVRRGDYAHLTFDLTAAVLLTAPSELLVLPNGFRPIHDVREVAINYISVTPVLVTVKTNGQVVAENNVPSGHRVLGSAKFPVF